MTQAGEFYEFAGPTDDGLYSGTAVSGSVDVKSDNRHGSARPDSSATQLLAGYIVTRSDGGDPTLIELAGDADTDWQGILIADQLDLGSGVYNTSQKIAYTTGGLVRLYVGAAIADDTYYCSDATGRARTWVDGVDDAQSIIGKTKSSATAAGEIVYATVEGE